MPHADRRITNQPGPKATRILRCSRNAGRFTRVLQDAAAWRAHSAEKGLMTPEIFWLLCLIGSALILFSFEWVPADVTALGILVALILTGLVPAERAFAGFGSDTAMMILGLLILTAALLRTGVVEMSGRFILRYIGRDPDRLLVVILLLAAALSAFISNTAATAFLLPMVIGLARRLRVSASKLLMPLAFASILASSITLISTSTNIVVSGLITRYELPPIGMFELTPVGVPIAIVGLIYMFLVGRRLIPVRDHSEQLVEEFGLRSYLAELVLLPKSPLVDKTLAQSGLGRDLDLTVLRIVRNEGQYLLPQADVRLEADDVLLVEGQREDILKIKDTTGMSIKADASFSDPDLQTEDMQLVEVFLPPQSPFIGRTLRRLRVRERYGLQVLALNRHGEAVHRRIGQIQLQMGDVLLVQGHRTNVAALHEDSTFRILGTVELRRPNLRRAPLAVIIFVGTLAAAALNLLSIPVAVLLGALLMFLTRCITPEEAYRQVAWKVLILIGSMLALGTAMEETGAARFLAVQIVGLAGGASPVWLLSAFFVLTVLLTQPMSNQAAAVIVLPIAVQTAQHAGLNPRTFAIMIAVAASCSFLTPLEPACLMVYGPGHYRFIDFMKIGAPLTVLIYGIAVSLVPIIWPF
jgi:di/tricarboxylate transporter